MSNEKKYLKWYNKFGYGIGGGSIASTSAIVNNFALLIMTDFVGLNAGIIGTIIMVSKLLDGVSDVVFGNILDRTKTPMGKARPWMLGAGFGVALCAILTVIMPANMSQFLKYAWFTTFYIAYNAVFYTAMSISYKTLTALITRSSVERVQLGMSYNFIMLAFMMVISTAAVPIANAVGWDKVAIGTAILGLACNLITVFSVKELPESEMAEEIAGKTMPEKEAEEKISFIESFKLLAKNRFYLYALVLNILFNFCSNLGSIATYYFTYVMHNANLYSSFNGSGFIASIIGMFAAPILIKKLGMYKGNLYSFTIGCFLRVLIIPSAMMGNVPMMLLFTVLSTLCTSSLNPTFNSITADIAEYTYKKEGRRVEGSMFSCVSMGAKIGSALGSGLCGWGLAAVGYVNGVEIQTTAVLNMMSFMYILLPIIAYFCMAFCLSKLNVQGAIENLKVKGE